MIQLAFFNVFSVLGAGASVWESPAAAADAIKSADFLSTDMALLWDEESWDQAYRDALAENRFLEAKTAQGKLARAVREMDGTALKARAEKFRGSALAILGFNLADASWAHRIQNGPPEKGIEPSLTPKIAVLRTARRADIEDAAGLALLLEYAEPIQRLILTTDPQEFAKIAETITRAVNERIIVEMEQKKTAVLKAAVIGWRPLLTYLDWTKRMEISGWGQNKAREIRMHNKVLRLISVWEPVLYSIRHGLGEPKDIEMFRARRQGNKDLEEMTDLAAAENALLLAAKGIRVEIGPALRGIAFENNAWDVLEEALIELIHNAAKYADMSKPERKIRVDFIPIERAIIVSDNGIGIQDIDRIWEEGFREAPDHAPGTGMGLGSVKAALEAIPAGGGSASDGGWKIKVVSTPGQGAAFRLLAPPHAVVYSEPLLKKMLKHQRDHFRHRQKFDFAQLTPQILSQMNPEEQVAVGKQAVIEIEEASYHLYAGIQKLKPNDLSGFKGLITRHFDWTRAIRHLREEARIHPKIDELFQSLFSSAIQLTTIMEQNHLSYDIEKGKRNGPKSWTNKVRTMVNPRELMEHSFRSGITCRVLRARRELSDTLIRWLSENLPKISKTESGYLFKGTRTKTPKTFSTNPLRLWPPDPQQDLAMRTYLELLGWSLKVEKEGETVRVWLDFNETHTSDLATLKVRVPPNAADLDDTLVQKILDANSDSKPFQNALRVFRDGMPEGYRTDLSPGVAVEKALVHELLTAGVRFWADGRLVRQSVAPALTACQKGAQNWRKIFAKRERQRRALDGAIQATREEISGVIPLHDPTRTEGDVPTKPPARPDVFDWILKVLRALQL